MKSGQSVWLTGLQQDCFMKSSASKLWSRDPANNVGGTSVLPLSGKIVLYCVHCESPSTFSLQILGLMLLQVGGLLLQHPGVSVGPIQLWSLVET